MVAKEGRVNSFMNPYALIDALLFVAGQEGLTVKELAEASQLPLGTVYEVLEEMQKEDEKSGIVLETFQDSYRYATKIEANAAIERLAQTPSMMKLTQAALETLIIIAYRQPVTRVEVDYIRGVNSSAALQKLEWHELIESCGRLDQPGRPKLYQTTNNFLQVFGLNSLEELPVLKEDISLEQAKDLLNFTHFDEKAQQGNLFDFREDNLETAKSKTSSEEVLRKGEEQ